MLEENIHDACVTVFSGQMKSRVWCEIEVVEICVEFALFEKILDEIVVAATAGQVKTRETVTILGVQHLIDG